MTNRKGNACTASDVNPGPFSNHKNRQLFRALLERFSSTDKDDPDSEPCLPRRPPYLPKDQAEIEAQVWAMKNLVPASFTDALTISMEQFGLSDEAFNSWGAANAAGMIRDVMNIIDRRAYGPHYNRRLRPTRFPFYARLETVSKRGWDARCHWHILMALDGLENVEDIEVQYQIVSKLKRRFSCKHAIKINTKWQSVDQTPEDFSRVSQYVTKKVLNDLDHIYTRSFY